MRKLFLGLVFLVPALAHAQTFTPEQAAKHVGDSVRVCGVIFGGKFFETSAGSPTVLNMGAAYPSAPLVLMIPGELRRQLDYVPEVKLQNANVCVTGRVKLFREKPEIVIYSIKQIEIKP